MSDIQETSFDRAQSTRNAEPPAASTAAAPADAEKRNWVDRFAPEKAKPYLRLMRADRPVGVWLLLMPCWWGLALAAVDYGAGLIVLWYGVLFAIGAFVMRGAGCAYNDIVDQDFDAKVERTALRPIPSGQISATAAAAFTAVLCLVGLIVLLQFNRQTIMLGVSSLALVAAYPFAKRVTYWPQAWLGLTFNWGVLVGYCALAGMVSWPAFILYTAGVFWTLGYDTIYAHQDREDDALIGVKSSALRLGASTRPWLAGFFGAAIGLFALAGLIGGFSIWYFALLALPGGHFFWQWKHLDIDDPARCLAVFKSNRQAGLLLLAPLLLEIVISAP